MLPTEFARRALPAALVSLGFALTAVAQGTAPATSGTSGGSASQGATAGSSSTGSSKSGASKSSASKSGQLDRSDRKFMEEAASGGLAEVELGQLASERAQSPEVKQFGQRMVQDHGKANEELKQLAQSKGVDLPTQPDKSHQKKMEKLQKLSGAQFDKQYMDEMVKDHKKDVKDFQKEAKSAKDPDLKSFASQTVPTLQEHLKMAQAAQKTAKAESKGSKTASAGSGRAGTSGSAGAMPSGTNGSSGASSGGSSATGSSSTK